MSKVKVIVFECIKCRKEKELNDVEKDKVQSGVDILCDDCNSPMIFKRAGGIL